MAGRLKLESQAIQGEAILKLVNDADPHFKKFARVKVYRLPKASGHLEKEVYEEGVLVKPSEIVLAGKEYHRFTYGAKERYLVDSSYQDHGRLSR